MNDSRRRALLLVLLVSVALGIAGTLVSCASMAPVVGLPAADHAITVLLTAPSGQPAVSVGLDAGLWVQDETGRAYRYPPGTGGHREIALRAMGGRVSMPGLSSAHTELTLRPLEGAGLRVGERSYRGDIIVAANGNEVVVRNRLPLDHYLYGVVPGEMPTSWPAPALEAQAVAARTYALFELKDREGAPLPHPFDVYDDTRSQVYKGLSGEDEKARAAVDATHGRAVVFAGKLVHTYFHSTCGGHTGDVSRVLGDAFTMPLSGRPCGYCTSSKYYEWDADLSAQEVAAQLSPLVQKAGHDPRSLGRLRAVREGRADRAGRLDTILAEFSEGTVEVPAPKARLAIGASKLRSVACRFGSHGDRILVRGRGWGHGVGMCQVGAKEQAVQGRSAQEIIEFYYPGSTLGLLAASSQ